VTREELAGLKVGQMVYGGEVPWSGSEGLTKVVLYHYMYMGMDVRDQAYVAAVAMEHCRLDDKCRTIMAIHPPCVQTMSLLDLHLTVTEVWADVIARIRRAVMQAHSLLDLAQFRCDNDSLVQEEKEEAKPKC